VKAYDKMIMNLHSFSVCMRRGWEVSERNLNMKRPCALARLGLAHLVRNL